MLKTALLCLLALTVSTGCDSVSGSISGSGRDSTLRCRLPVISPTTSTDPVPGGWITFPGGHFERDPTSLPIRLQTHVPSYDRAIKSWVPVESRYVAPSGDSYILPPDASLREGGFHLVNGKTGTQRLVLGGDGPPEAPGSWTVVAYATAGVYLWSAGIETVPGLWLLDPATGKVHLIDGSHYWRIVAGGAAWALDPQGPEPGAKQAVYRLNLASGRVERWYETDKPIHMLSPDSDGHVLVVIGDDSSPRLGLLVGPDQFQPFTLPPDFPLVADGYLQHPGVWLSLRLGGLALYTAADGVRIMTRNTDIFDLAGGCW